MPRQTNSNKNLDDIFKGIFGKTNDIVVFNNGNSKTRNLNKILFQENNRQKKK